MSTPIRLWNAILRSSILWGCGLSAGFFWLIHDQGPLANAFLQRYTAGHPINSCETIFFFIGVAILVRKAIEAAVQFRGQGRSLLGAMPAHPQAVEECDALLDRLDHMPASRQRHYLPQRLREALEQIRRCRSASTLEDELRVLSQQDADRQYGSYAFLRIIIWAIPILGFLGTVVGITMAIANLSFNPEALEQSTHEVVSGLAVAFDTTALALALAMFLMFGQYVVERLETALLARVDQQAADELLGRFEQLAPGADGQMQAVRHMAESVLQAVEILVRRQAELWQSTIDAAQQKWTRSAETTGKQLQTAMAAGLAESLKTHAQQVAAIEHAAAEQNRRQWEPLQRSLTQSVETLGGLQAVMARQAEVLHRAIEASGEVARLEETLNRNLAALAGSKNFEQTVMSLAAAIHLLNGRLAGGDAAAVVHLAPSRKTSQAA